MIRHFKFEDEVHQSLSCVPMAVRRKLDRIGLKIGLDQWQQLSRGERLAVCHLPVESAEEQDVARTFMQGAVHASMRRHCEGAARGVAACGQSTADAARDAGRARPCGRNYLEKPNGRGLTMTSVTR